METPEYIDRVFDLVEIPAAVRFVSYEPALAPLYSLTPGNLDGVDWLIYGGESGRGFREDSILWAIHAAALCRVSRTAFFFKQLSGLRPGDTKGGAYQDVLTQDFPTVGIPQVWKVACPDCGGTGRTRLALPVQRECSGRNWPPHDPEELPECRGLVEGVDYSLMPCLGCYGRGWFPKVAQ